MKTFSRSLRAIGILLGTWGFVGCVFFTVAFTFRQDAWQIFGGAMLLIIILLGRFIIDLTVCKFVPVTVI